MSDTVTDTAGRKVNSTDASIVSNHNGQFDGWSIGDMNGDGIVNSSDSTIITNNSGKFFYNYLHGDAACKNSDIRFVVA